MAALWNRTDYYIFARVLFLLSSLYLFCPRLISAVRDWMSTILPHMLWPWCEFRMQVWNVLHAACWKCRTQKIAKHSPSWYHRTTLSGYIFANKTRIDKWKNVKQQCLPHMSSQYGELRPTSGWDRFVSFGHPSYNFNGFRVLAALLHGTLVVGVSQTLRRWTEATPIFGSHDVGHWPTF